MPLFEISCGNADCTLHAKRVERLLRRYDEPNPPCHSCGGETVRLVSKPRLAWLGELTDYDDRNRETYHQDQALGGHTVACKRSNGGTEEKPIFRRIRTRKQQLDYCRAEGLCDPAEAPGTMSVNSEGTETGGSGMPGQWV